MTNLGLLNSVVNSELSSIPFPKLEIVINNNNNNKCLCTSFHKSIELGTLQNSSLVFYFWLRKQPRSLLGAGDALPPCMADGRRKGSTQAGSSVGDAARPVRGIPIFTHPQDAPSCTPRWAALRVLPSLLQPLGQPAYLSAAACPATIISSSVSPQSA